MLLLRKLWYRTLGLKKSWLFEFTNIWIVRLKWVSLIGISAWFSFFCGILCFSREEERVWAAIFGEVLPFEKCLFPLSRSRGLNCVDMHRGLKSSGHHRPNGVLGRWGELFPKNNRRDLAAGLVHGVLLAKHLDCNTDEGETLKIIFKAERWMEMLSVR